jgi:hypothetical protein
MGPIIFHASPEYLGGSDTVHPARSAASLR